MWIPQTEDEIVAAVTSGSLEETTIFDAKREIPSRNADTAIDIAAMSTNGGVIIYGIDEDSSNRPTILHPIPHVNQPERITAIVQSSIAEPPKISIRTIPTAADATLGYLVVVIPPSDRAPHMVVVRGDNRFYGRNATGNYVLNEGEVARLYERRQRIEIDRDAMLAVEIAQSPLVAHPDFSYLHLIARPVVRDEGLLDQSVRAGETRLRVISDLIAIVAEPEVFVGDYFPDFRTFSSWRQRTEGLLFSFGATKPTADPRAPAEILNLQVDFDGSLHLFCGRAAERISETLQVFPSLVAGLSTRSLTFLGLLYARARYLGMVDIGVAITGARGATPQMTRGLLIAGARPYDREDYRRTSRSSALFLRDDPQSIAKNILMPFFSAVSQGGLDPFPNV